MGDLEGLFQLWTESRQQEVLDVAPNTGRPLPKNVERPLDIVNLREPQAPPPPPPPPPPTTILPSPYPKCVVPPPPPPPLLEPITITTCDTPEVAPVGVKMEAEAKEVLVSSPPPVRLLDPKQIATIVRVTPRQRSESTEKEKKKREKQEILLYGRYYKCKLQLKAVQREIMSACEKHRELMEQMVS